MVSLRYKIEYRRNPVSLAEPYKADKKINADNTVDVDFAGMFPEVWGANSEARELVFA